MQGNHFLSELQDCFDDALILSLRAQKQGDTVAERVLSDLQGLVGYRLAYVSRQAKSRERWFEKAIEIYRGNPSLSPHDVAGSIKDMAAGRILVVGLRDVGFTHRYFREQVQLNQHLSCTMVGDPKEYLGRAKKGGFRGLIQHTELAFSDGRTFPFELQIMTYLQQAWDQLQRRLYEQMRSGKGVSSAINTSLEELSDKLHELDQEISATRLTMLEQCQE